MEVAEGASIRKIRLIICEPCRLVYRPLSKCASTTMYGLLARLGGMEAGLGSNPRRLLPVDSKRIAPGRGGSYEVIWSLDEVAGILEAYGDYTVFSVIRNPFDRTVSNYHSKLNRFARRFATPVYFGGYLGPLANGRSPLSPGDRIRWMQRWISFDRFIDGLAERGISWDGHFDSQVSLLGGNSIAYDRLIPMESLASGLRDLFVGRDRMPSVSGILDDVGRLNASHTRSPSAKWTERTQSLVERLYAADFEKLGYAARTAA